MGRSAVDSEVVGRDKATGRRWAQVQETWRRRLLLLLSSPADFKGCGVHGLEQWYWCRVRVALPMSRVRDSLGLSVRSLSMVLAPDCLSREV